MTESSRAEIRTSLEGDDIAEVTRRLRPVNAGFARRYPGDGTLRQPVHSVYGGAQLFAADTGGRLGAVALRTLEEYAPDAEQLAEAVGIADDSIASRAYERVVEKLHREPVEDFRIDFEDGYGVRSDAEEDGHAVSVAMEVARGATEEMLPPFIGIRIKPLTEELHLRSLRTLDIFVTTLVKSLGRLPTRFILTLPKITDPEQAAAFAGVLERLEERLGLDAGALTFEAMVETPQLVIDAAGRSSLPSLIDAARGRLAAAHFGTYDYTAALNITAAYQRMRHPACDFARQVMQVAFAGTGVWLSDGSTTVMPVAIHRSKAGATLSVREVAENRASIYHAWRMHYEDVRHSLANGFYQGWDLHPAQLITRYTALYAFFLTGLAPQAQRLRNFVERSAQATLVGDVFDDAATGQGLLNFFLRAINCGALTEEEVTGMTGVTLTELRTRSFVRILESRRSNALASDSSGSK